MYNKSKSENLYSIMEDSTLERNRIEIDNREVVLSIDDISTTVDNNSEFPPPSPPEEEIVAIVTKKEPKGFGNMVAYNVLPEMLEHVN